MDQEEFEYEYKWDYQTITQEIPELQNYLIKGRDLKKISEKLAVGVTHLLSKMKNLVKVDFGKKKSLYNMKFDTMRKVNPEKLAEYFFVLANSLVDMVKRGNITKMQILEIRAKNMENVSFKEKVGEKMKAEKLEYQHQMGLAIRKQVLLKKGMQKKDNKILSYIRRNTELREKFERTEKASLSVTPNWL